MPALDVLLGEAMWADMLSASIAFQKCPAAHQLAMQLPRTLAAPVDHRDRERTRMPVLAAMATITPSVFAGNSTVRRARHAV